MTGGSRDTGGDRNCHQHEDDLAGHAVRAGPDGVPQPVARLRNNAGSRIQHKMIDPLLATAVPSEAKPHARQ